MDIVNEASENKHLTNNVCEFDYHELADSNSSIQS